MSKTEMKDIPLAEIRIDGGTQPRIEIDLELVKEYKEAYERGDNMEPSDVFWDGSVYWLADGFHRWHGSNAAKAETLDCRIHNGTQRDAVLFSVGANAIHGLKRSPADKRNAVMKLLNDAEWCKWSSREIAEKCNVGHTLVNEIRSSLDLDSSDKPPTERKFKTKHGTESTMKTGGINSSPRKTKPKTGIASDPEQDRIDQMLGARKPPKEAAVKERKSQFNPDELEAESAALKVDLNAPVIDENGQQVPKNLADIFRQVPAWKSAMKMVSDLKSVVKKLYEHPAGGYLDVQEIERLIAQTRTQLKFAMPYAECPKCRRKPVKSCDNCKGTGWLTKPRLSACACDDDMAWLGARK